MKDKSAVFVAAGILLVGAIIVSYLVARPFSFVSARKAPVFMGNQILVKEILPVAKPAKVAKIEKLMAAPQVISQPLPPPKLATSLPFLPPRISYSILPQYPEAALKKELEGTTLLSVYISPSGAPEKVQVKSSSGVVSLDQAALMAISQWSFYPAIQGGKAVASWFEVPVRFIIN